MLNGAVINENLRGVPMTPYIEDARKSTVQRSASRQMDDSPAVWRPL